MDINQLRSLVTIARCGTVARAAELLHLSQPAISAHIKLLEEELRARLFERHAKGMTLTATGEAVFRHAKHILHAVEAIKDEVNSLIGDAAGELVIGTVNDPAFLRLPAFLRHMREAAPQVTISLVQTTSGSVLKNIADGVFDAGFVEGNLKGQAVTSLLLTNAEFVVGYPAAWHDQVEVGGLASALDLPWIGTSDGCSFYQLTNALFAAHGRNFTPAIRTDQEALLLDLVGQEAGLSLVRRDMLESYPKDDVRVLDGVVVDAGVHFVMSQTAPKPGLLRVAQQAVQRAWQIEPTR
ncbi:MAG TPA: LysR family transcriptional regulator [Noviherbaspirillum sp.]|uniref:LysR substrate-binding domain-containing protein n=1 Tax=Noviherbaspirillum sp. TaxID=1926288 RepID=UPI002D691063|nr:LysR family transcriptional regulator [Noviherbaspirillum sp.]HYD96559.1 LysR family transcriptional regulator [Noviherbaspirillum sp.]